ncbi:hypothetical protein F2Q69_00054333 [Brassica cretica]|uniref:Uncharacterized protein n=1 Tax=Brassica cretica TaxID=69181 RepID=A0A8S9N232_BRACR|nr:hypothetical protein F2Q69_00054333 [Brassica cretica]
MIVPARPSANLDMAELVACLVQLGHPPSCTGSARWMAELVDADLPQADGIGKLTKSSILCQKMGSIKQWEGHHP